MKRTQRDKLLTLFRYRGNEGVTAADAYELAGVQRFAARVWDMRAEGLRIDTHWMTTAGGARVARYVLVERPEQLRLEVTA